MVNQFDFSESDDRLKSERPRRNSRKSSALVGLYLLTGFHFLIAFGTSWLSWIGIEALLWDKGISTSETIQIPLVMTLNALCFLSGIGLLIRRPWAWWAAYILQWIMGCALGGFAIVMFIITFTSTGLGGGIMFMLLPLTVFLPVGVAFISMKGVFYMKRLPIQELFGKQVSHQL